MSARRATPSPDGTRAGAAKRRSAPPPAAPEGTLFEPVRGPRSPRVVITLGDPQGIGPEVAALALASSEGAKRAAVTVVGPSSLWGGRLAAGTDSARDPLRGAPRPGSGQAGALRPDDSGEARRASGAKEALPEMGPATEAGTIRLIEPLGGSWPPGDGADAPPSAAAGAVAFAALDVAVRWAAAGEIDAIVTAPVSKEAIVRSGLPFVGHTELLANALHTPNPVMCFVSGPHRIALVTLHVPLRRVPLLMTTSRVLATLRTLHDALRSDFGVTSPRIAVCGFNPHAGEGGLFGSEERLVLAPALADARRHGIGAEGPFPADGLFGRLTERSYDAVLAMYHDQGLIAAKLLAPGHAAVNVTLGLPIVRTSPAHGTAFDIAGRGSADPASMRAALDLAVELAERRAGRGRVAEERIDAIRPP